MNGKPPAKEARPYESRELDTEFWMVRHFCGGEYGGFRTEVLVGSEHV